MKKVAIMQPYLFPYLGYFQTMNAVDEYVIYDDVQFIKGGWISRNNILVNGDKHLFSFNLAGASPNKLINEVGLQGDFAKFEKMIAASYARAPYIKEVSDLVHQICAFEDLNLARFIGNSLFRIADYLGIDTKLVYASSLSDDKGLHAQERVISICSLLGATTYINAIGGVELYEKKAFQEAGIELKFLKTLPVEYSQKTKEFVPGLSIIDVMMFNSPKEIRGALNKYELI